jgi:glutamyl-tRNA reductase
MDPVLYTYHIPRHDPAVVARNVVRQHLADHLLLWRRMSDAQDLVFLATCQRVVWMFWGGDGTTLGFGPDIDCFQGEAAWRHLLEVATGLNSANLGDREVVGQVRQALAMAKETGTAGAEAQAAIEDLLREAQRLRTRIGLDDGSASVATAALRHLESTLPAGSRVAVVGVGPMSRYLAQRLPERGFHLTMSNRTLAKAEAFGLPMVPLAQLQIDPQGFDAIVTATASSQPLFLKSNWARLDRPPVRVVDLALPYDSEPELGEIPWVTRVDLNTFLAETEVTKELRAEAAAKAEPYIVGAVERMRKRAEARGHRSSMRTAQERLTDAWDQMEHEALAPGSALAELEPDQLAALGALLKRGRTLAFRALNSHREGTLDEGDRPDASRPLAAHKRATPQAPHAVPGRSPATASIMEER